MSAKAFALPPIFREMMLRYGLSSGGLERKQALAQMPPHYLRTSLPLRKRRRFLNLARVWL